MPRSLKTEAELMKILTESFAEDPLTQGWLPAAIDWHEPDAEGCNWDVRDIRRAKSEADVPEVSEREAAGIIAMARARYNLA